MDSISFGSQGRQRRNLWFLAIGYPLLWFVAGGVLVVVGQTGAAGFAATVGIAATLVGATVLSSRTVVDGTGIRVERLMGSWACSWEQTASVMVRQERTRRAAGRRIVVRGVNGGTWKLPVPFDTPTWGLDDLDFDERAEAIITAWQEHRSTR